MHSKKSTPLHRSPISTALLTRLGGWVEGGYLGFCKHDEPDVDSCVGGCSTQCSPLSSTVKWWVRSRPSSTSFSRRSPPSPGGQRKVLRNEGTFYVRLLRRKEGRTRDHEGSRSSTSVLAQKGQKEQARNEFPFRFRYVYLSLPLGARGYCGWKGLEWKGVEFNCPTGELDSHEERNGFRVSHSVAVGQGRFRNNGY